MLQKNPSSEGGKVLQNLGQTGPYVMRTDTPISSHRLWVHRPKPSFAFPSAKVLQILSQRNTCRTWARVSSGLWLLPIFALSHVPCSIRPITDRPLLLPTSSCHPSIGLPYGRLARRRAWRTDGFSTFLTIASDNLGGTWTPVALQSSCRDVRDLHLGHACKHWEACLRPLSSRRSERA
jgi:hypothetical protein